ncbi:TlpA family protein disulfide reductase [Sphingomonas canadensis]|uniref:TlpA family protein disulfide reductase n=1 Tax=Sphingomonas canadensis TaxID=1219257 RepID=A0ABW3H4V5_9SPHN|nr:TlpA disulfide reductase family protein [Sphingomonas canadensis]MCW3835887.1 TlpA family protein disulfide reductase [Sphingomonas canadensis]
MNRGIFRIAFALAAVTLLPGASASAPPVPLPLGKPVVGKPAPDFRIKMFDGTSVSLSDLRGQVVVLNLWASWCGPCKTEMPALDLMQVNGGRHGLRIFGVKVMDATPRQKLRKLESLLHYPLATDISGGYVPIGRAVPTNYIIDRKGVVRYARPAVLTKEDFADLLVPLLNEKP